MVHQHFMLVEPFTVLENLLLGAEGGVTLAGGAARARAEIAALEREYGLDVDLDATVADLPVGVQQRVEILKALFRGARVLILDEPTGVLTPQEADHLFRILRNLRDQGRTVVLITHKLREIMAATDNVSVMRQGAMVAHRPTAETSTEELAELMVGRKVLLRVEKGAARPGEPVLEVERLVVRDGNGVTRVKGVSFTVRAGEIVGIAGVAGNGQSELLEALAGIRPPAGGAIRIKGRPLGDAGLGRTAGLGHVPEDRLRMGLVRDFSAYENAILGYHLDPEYSRHGLLATRGIIGTCLRWMRGYDVRPCDAQLKAGAFSGGNQQKLVLAREMEHDPDLLLVGQPTRGVDIGAIEFIHKRLIEMRDRGKAVLLVSVELDEILLARRPHPRDVRRHDHRRAQRRGRRRAPDRPPDGRHHRGSGGVMLLLRAEQATYRLSQQRRARAAARFGQGVELFEVCRRQHEIDLPGPGQPIRHRHRKGDGLGVLRIDHDHLEPRGRGDRQMLLEHALDVELQRLGGHLAGLLERAAGRDAAREVGEVDPIVAVGILAQQRDVGGHDELLGQSHARLALDALQGAVRHVLAWMLHGNAVGTVGMPELVMAAFDPDQPPAGGLELPDDRPAVHRANHVERERGRQAEAGG